jgi:hypothetical protein
MADQTERSPKANNYPTSNIAIPGRLRNEIRSGQRIDAQDIVSLINIINDWIGHTHTYDDAYQLATFGNNGDRNDYYEDKTTSNTLIAWVPSVSSGNLIQAGTHNAMRNACNSLRGHSHNIDDRTS